MKENSSSLINILIYTCFFITGISWNFGFELKSSYILILIFLALVSISSEKIFIHHGIIAFLMFIGIYSTIMAAFEKTTLGSVANSILGCIIFSTSMFTFFSINQNSISSIVKNYVKISVIMSLIAMLQEVGFLLNIPNLYDFSYMMNINNIDTTNGFLRVYSLFPEPSHFAYFLVPSSFLALRCLIYKEEYFSNKYQSILILFTLILTGSLVSYVSIAVCLIMCIEFKSISHGIVCVVFLIAAWCFAIDTISKNIPGISSRIESIQNVGQDDGVSNASVFAIYSNSLVAIQGFKYNPLLGSGINSSDTTYEESISKYYDVNSLMKQQIYGLQRKDSGSLFLRVLAELGIVGMFCILRFFYIYRVRKSQGNCKIQKEKIIISKMCLVFVLCYSLRMGSYLVFELWFFTAMYFFVNKPNFKLPSIGA